MMRRPPRSTLSSSSAASDVYKRQDELEDLLKNEEVNEIILATNATIEGEVTAHYIYNLAKKYQIKTTRIAHGIPLGGELEYTDINTIAHALSGRKSYDI